MTKQDLYSWYKNDTGQSVSEQAGITITCPKCNMEIEDEFSMSEFPYVRWLEEKLEQAQKQIKEFKAIPVFKAFVDPANGKDYSVKRTHL